MSNRINCLIFGCKRTRVNKPGFTEWICSKHWAVIPKKYRRLHSMAGRKFKKGQISVERVNGIWNKCKDWAFRNAWSIS